MINTTRLLGMILLMASAVVSPASADEPDWNLRVELVDGSRIIGTTSNKMLQVDLDFGELKIPFERIRRATRAKGKKTIRIELTNGDVFSGKLIAEPLNVQTIFGPVKLSMDHVVSLEVIPKDSVGWLPTKVDLVLYYPLDDGKSATNHAADKHHGKVTGVKWLEKGRRGGGFEFSGTGRISVAHNADLCPSKLTLAAWIWPKGSSSYQIVMAKTNGGSWSQGYGLVRNSGDSKHLRFFVNGYTSSYVQAEVPNDKWSHVAGVFDGTNLSFFLNGKQVATKRIRPVGAASIGPVITHSTSPLVFGGSPSYSWQGKMDDIALYKRPLSADEVRRLFELGSRN